MGKTNGVEHKRRAGLLQPRRDRAAARLRRSDQESLSRVSGDPGPAVRGRSRTRKASPTWKPDGANTNWRVGRDGADVVAVEPNRDYEHVFDGADPFGEALEYAAEQLRKSSDASD